MAPKWSELIKAREDDIKDLRRTIERRLRELEHLHEGSCPQHGIPLNQTGASDEGSVNQCPRRDCAFSVVIPWRIVETFFDCDPELRVARIQKREEVSRMVDQTAQKLGIPRAEVIRRAIAFLETKGKPE